VRSQADFAAAQHDQPGRVASGWAVAEMEGGEHHARKETNRMRKLRKGLTLSRETLFHLDHDHLRKVNGATTTPLRQCTPSGDIGPACASSPPNCKETVWCPQGSQPFVVCV
jgi:hypothetical protein